MADEVEERCGGEGGGEGEGRGGGGGDEGRRRQKVEAETEEDAKAKDEAVEEAGNEIWRVNFVLAYRKFGKKKYDDGRPQLEDI